MAAGPRVEIEWLLPDGSHCPSLEIASRNAQRLIEMHVITTHPMTFGNDVLPAGVALRSSTLQASVLSHAVGAVLTALLTIRARPSGAELPHRSGRRTAT